MPELVRTHKALAFRIAKYLISGSTVAFIDLVLLYVLVDMVHVNYLPASVFAFVVAVTTSFILQKYWTFEDQSRDRVKRQFTQYWGVAAINLVGNTIFIFILVDFAGFHYLISQTFLMAIFAIINYFLYRIIFKIR